MNPCVKVNQRHNYMDNPLIIYPMFSLMRDHRDIAKWCPYKRDSAIMVQYTGRLY